MASSGEIADPCPVPFFLYRHDSLFKDAGSQPFLDEPEDALVADAMLQETDHPFLRHLREERPDIGVEYVAHLPGADSGDERVQRVMLAAPRPESVRKPEKIFLVDRVQHHGRGSLDDFVFERRDRQRAPTAVFLWDINPPGR